MRPHQSISLCERYVPQLFNIPMNVGLRWQPVWTASPVPFKYGPGDIFYPFAPGFVFNINYGIRLFSVGRRIPADQGRFLASGCLQWRLTYFNSDHISFLPVLSILVKGSQIRTKSRIRGRSTRYPPILSRDSLSRQRFSHPCLLFLVDWAHFPLIKWSTVNPFFHGGCPYKEGYFGWYRIAPD